MPHINDFPVIFVHDRKTPPDSAAIVENYVEPHGDASQVKIMILTKETHRHESLQIYIVFSLAKVNNTPMCRRYRNSNTKFGVK